MTRQEHIDQLKEDLKKAEAYGDYIKAHEVRDMIFNLEKTTDQNYGTYIKLMKMYAENSVISGIMSSKVTK